MVTFNIAVKIKLDNCVSELCSGITTGKWPTKEALSFSCYRLQRVVEFTNFIAKV